MQSSIARWTPLLLLAGWTLSGCSSRPQQPIWNVPEVMGKPIDAVKQKLGTPQSETAIDGEAKQSIWQRDDATLTATWKTGNKRVREWTLISRDDTHAAREEERNQLLRPGQLKENDPGYSVDWIEADQRPLYYTGVRIVPALKNHTVQLRLSGSPAAVKVEYQATGPQGKTESFLTIAPWEESFTFPDDTQISFNAVLTKALSAGKIDLKIEIVEDGQVVGTAASGGEAIRCQAEL